MGIFGKSVFHPLAVFRSLLRQKDRTADLVKDGR
jgi:hypothetical protein